MDRYQYLILMGLCLLVTLPLEFLFRARVYRRPRRLLAAVVPPLVVFVAWDLVAIARGHWDFSPRYTTGWELPVGLPVEELSFFVAIPLCTLLTLEAVRWGLARLASWSAVRRPAPATVAPAAAPPAARSDA